MPATSICHPTAANLEDLDGNYNHFLRHKNDDTQLLQSGAFFYPPGRNRFCMIKQSPLVNSRGAPFNIIFAIFADWEKAKGSQCIRLCRHT